MKKLILFTSVALASGVLFANVYNSMVNAVATDSDIPNSVMAAREFFKTVNPGDFFRIFSPATQIFTLLSLILFWRTAKSARVFLGIALLCYILGDIFAFTYFHPRSDLMFLSEPVPDDETLRRLSSEWSSMNWVRSFVLLVGVVCLFLAVDRIYSFKQKTHQTEL
ncbi:DUF1772 domain-containing protein [Chryseobacterium sp. Leaf394]|uniref:DUF1772 domain-containing protein n=1 Tax=Chryseobacterium sp. Leaf394 TaxID=1736361 RepID=UPI0006F9B0E6|nr:DUF1772 domain-containing protein [Chryseobacterium sp. Leaf394]KQS92264.1 hypothetical protein ASG21_07425 [Chryseobacterium sp. Leaf394]